LTPEVNEFSDREEPFVESPLFEPQFGEVSESVEEPDFTETPTSEVEISEEEEFIFNEVTNPLFEMDVVDPEIVPSESQILMDFELPISDQKPQTIATPQECKRFRAHRS
jgi:hypothetical protein